MSFTYAKKKKEFVTTVEYRGHTLTVIVDMVEVEGEWERDYYRVYADLPGDVDYDMEAYEFGRKYRAEYLWWGRDEEHALKRAKHAFDERALDDEQRGTVEALALACPTGLRTLDDAPNASRARPATLTTPQIGDVAWVHGTGRYRRGYVYKLGKSRIGVAYYVPSSGRIYRRSEKPGDVYLTGEKV